MKEYKVIKRDVNNDEVLECYTFSNAIDCRDKLEELFISAYKEDYRIFKQPMAEYMFFFTLPNKYWVTPEWDMY